MSKILPIIIIFLLLVGFTPAFPDDIFPKYTEFTLSNGLRTVLIEDHSQPTVSISVLFKTGPSSDPPEIVGRAILTGYMMKETTHNFPGSTLLEAIDSVGGIMDISVASKDGLILEGDFLSRDISLALKLIADILTYPVFTQEALERMSRRLVSINLQTRTIPQYRLMETLYEKIYGDCGYGLPALGTRTSLANVTLEDVIDFHDNHVRPDNAIMIIGGDIRPDIVRKSVSNHFNSWKKGGVRSAVNYYPVPQDSLKIILIDNPAVPNADFMIGLPTAPVGAGDFPEMLVLNYILGGGGRVSRLHIALVEEKGLASVVNSELDWSQKRGVLRISASTPCEVATEAIQQTLDIIRELHAIRIPQKELDEARYYFRGYAPMLYENVALSVDQFIRFLSMNVDLSYQQELLSEIDRITPLSIQTAAENYLDENKMTIVVIGSKAALLPPLSTLGSVEVFGLDEE